MELTLTQISKTAEGELHLSGIDLELKSGGKYVILGRTLAGKTSLLRIMAGLDRPTSGKILADGKDVTGLSVRKRSVAMVYQQFINYPSFTVYDNIASPLKVAGVPKSEIRDRVETTAKLLHLTPMLNRLPAELSGGQQQRVAIARALMKDTDLLLLDEPLVNLDYKLREELLEELQLIFDRRNAVVVYTTTEPAEALKLGGHIVVMDEGRVLQTGKTSQVYRNPATTRTAALFSDPPINFFDGEILDRQVRIGPGISFDRSPPYDTLSQGRYCFGIRPDHFYLSRQTARDVALNSRVEISEINGSETFIHFKYADKRTVLQEVGITPKKIGSDITIFINPEKFFVYSEAGALLVSPDRPFQDT